MEVCKFHYIDIFSENNSCSEVGGILHWLRFNNLQGQFFVVGSTEKQGQGHLSHSLYT